MPSASASLSHRKITEFERSIYPRDVLLGQREGRGERWLDHPSLRHPRLQQTNKATPMTTNKALPIPKAKTLICVINTVLKRAQHPDKMMLNCPTQTTGDLTIPQHTLSYELNTPTSHQHDNSMQHISHTRAPSERRTTAQSLHLILSLLLYQHTKQQHKYVYKSSTARKTAQSLKSKHSYQSKVNKSFYIPCPQVSPDLFHQIFSAIPATHSQAPHKHKTIIMNQQEALSATITLLKAITTPSKVKATFPENYSAADVLAAHPAFPKSRLFYTPEDIHLLTTENTKKDCQVLFDYELTIQKHIVGSKLKESDKRFKAFVDTMKDNIVEHYKKHGIQLQRPYIIPVTTYFPPTNAAKASYHHYLSYPTSYPEMIKLFSLPLEEHLKHTYLAGVLPNHDPLEYTELSPYTLLCAGCTHADIPDLKTDITDPRNELPGLQSLTPHKEMRSDYSTI